MAGFNIILSINERRSSSDKKYNKSLRLVLFFPFRCCFAGSYLFLYRQWNKRNYSTPFPKCFSIFLARKTLWVKLFSLNVCEAALQAAIKGGNFSETHTPLWLLIGRIIFLTREKTSFAILIGRIIFFTCENYRSLLWLARTHLRTKIYDIAFWWVFLSMYIIRCCITLGNR